MRDCQDGLEEVKPEKEPTAIVESTTREIREDDRFDEARYLDANPDVQRAINAGLISSAFEHYATIGHSERRRGAPRDLARAVELYLNHPVAPAHLRLRVSGSAEYAPFIAAGLVMASNLVKAIPDSAALTNDGYVLDFGCGCGRIAPFFKKLRQCRLYGTDIDVEAIDWCDANLQSVGTFQTNEFLPPFRYDSGMFDLVYSVSIFTHLPEDMQFAWLSEIRRVTKPGSYALLTVQGKWLFPGEHATDQQAGDYEAKGFSYLEGDLTAGLPEFYRTTIHSDHYVRSRWSEFFEIETVIHRGVNNHQDIVVCRAT
jgi:SAM-dependent methyltransferase